MTSDSVRARIHEWTRILLCRNRSEPEARPGEVIRFRCNICSALHARIWEQLDRTGELAAARSRLLIGKLVKPEEKDASLKYVFGNGLVDAITVGMLKPEEVDDTLTRMSQVKV